MLKSKQISYTRWRAMRFLQVTREGVDTELRAKGRHDACVVPRAVPMVESMVALVLADQLLQHYAQVRIGVCVCVRVVSVSVRCACACVS